MLQNIFNSSHVKDECTGEVKKVTHHMWNEKINGDRKMENPIPCQQLSQIKPTLKKTTCYTCEPKRKDAYPADPKCFSLKYLNNFAEFKPGQTKEHVWNYFCAGSDKKFIADDGCHRITHEFLEMKAHKFEKTHSWKHNNSSSSSSSSSSYGNSQIDGFLDHFKTLALLNSEFDVPDCGELYAEAHITSKTRKTENHPFGDAVLNHDADFRLGCSIMSMIDFDSGLHIAHLITNDSHYALYEKIPNDNDDDEEEARRDPGSAAFAFAKLIGRRDKYAPLNDWARLGLAVDKRKGAKWYINGVLKHSVDRLGYWSDPADGLYQYGGNPCPITLSCVSVGFGFFTMLDAVRPNNYGDIDAAGTALVRLTGFKYRHPFLHKDEVKFVVDDYDYDQCLWGQGATLRIKEIKIENRA